MKGDETQVVAPYGNANAAYHLRFKEGGLSFCGRKTEGWIVLQTTVSEAMGSAYGCKNCRRDYYDEL